MTGVLAKLSDPHFFSQVYVDPELGTITWPGELDLGLYEQGLTVEEMVPALGLNGHPIYVNSGDDAEDRAEKGDAFRTWYEEELLERYERLRNNTDGNAT